MINLETSDAEEHKPSKSKATNAVPALSFTSGHCKQKFNFKQFTVE